MLGSAGEERIGRHQNDYIDREAVQNAHIVLRSGENLAYIYKPVGNAVFPRPGTEAGRRPLVGSSRQKAAQTRQGAKSWQGHPRQPRHQKLPASHLKTSLFCEMILVI